MGIELIWFFFLRSLWFCWRSRYEIDIEISGGVLIKIKVEWSFCLLRFLY